MTFDCKSFEDRIGDLLAGQASAAEIEAARAHRHVCATCRELWDLATGDLTDLALDPPDGLTESILAATSGSTCDAARERLCGLVDGQLEPVDDELLTGHLRRCGECAALARVLERLATDLPELAELEPDDRFVADVLARTVQARPVVTAVPRVETGWIERFVAGWHRVLARPRVALEGAYVGTFALALVFLTPSAPLAAVPRMALDMLAENPVARVESRLSEEAESAWYETVEVATSAWQENAARVAETWQTKSNELATWSSHAIEKIRNELGTLSGSPASEQETDGADAASESEAGDSDPDEQNGER